MKKIEMMCLSQKDILEMGLEMAEIIKSSKFFLGNLSLGYSIAEGLKVPRLLEACPEFPAAQPHGKNAYNFYFQKNFENLFNYLNNLNQN